MNKLFSASLSLAKLSEMLFERILFNQRLAVLTLFMGLTLFLAFQGLQIRPDASFVKMIPAQHSFVQNFLNYRDDLSGLGNSVRVAVEATEGDIFTPEYQETLKQVTDEIFFIPGVDRSSLKSIWTPNIRWTEVTEEGFVGGPVIPPEYDGSAQSLEQMRINILRSGQVGRLVANDFRSAVIEVPLFDKDPKTGKKLDYKTLSDRLETLVRSKYERDGINISIIGFAKIVGDLIAGSVQVALFFLIAISVTLVLLFLYSRSVAGTLIPVLCSLIAVFWQLGVLKLLGYGLDPYSMLVPFLVFAIGVSHGVQIINTTIQEAAQGVARELAARRAFRAIYIPGLTALVSDGIGFVTLMVIEIEVIQDLAVAASVGVAVIIITNLLLMPVLLSFTGVGKKAVSRAQRSSESTGSVWQLMTWFAKPKGAATAVAVAASLLLLGMEASKDLKVGDLDKGAPELRSDSRYNLDSAFITANYSTSSDVFVVMAATQAEQCSSFTTLSLVRRFQHYMTTIDGVQSSLSLANVAERVTAGLNEGNLKWSSVSRNQYVINAALGYVPPGLMNNDCSLLPVIFFLDDHKAETLLAVTQAAEGFIANNPSQQVEFLMAAGNSGFEAATNEVIATAQYEMLLWVYGVVSCLCLLTFRSIKIVLCIIVPLALTSLLCQALMAQLGIGVKVATLPVIALGVGIGVDYGIYIYSKLNTFLLAGKPLPEAYLATLKTTGKSVAFTGFTLAIGVVLWVLSPIKFQADMGILLTFMFLWNMLGALILIPALTCLLSPPRRHTQTASQDSKKVSREETNKESINAV